MIKGLLFLLLINFVSCALVRLCHGGRLEVRYESWKMNHEPKVFLIAGIKNWPGTAYQSIDFGERNRVALDFSLLGFNARNAGEQLVSMIDTGDTVVGVSIGAKPIEYEAHRIRGKAVLVNPCSHRIALKAPWDWLTRYLSPFAEVIAYGLGWLAILPIIPADLGHRTSFALLIDQLFWIGWGEPEVRCENAGVVISLQDEFLETEVLRDLYGGAEQIEIETQHGRTASATHGQAQLYNAAIGEILS